MFQERSRFSTVIIIKQVRNPEVYRQLSAENFGASLTPTYLTKARNDSCRKVQGFDCSILWCAQYPIPKH